MPDLTPDIMQIGAVAIIFLFCAREFFSYLKSRKGEGKNGTYLGIDKELMLINQKLDNHIEHICEAMTEMKMDIKGIKDDIVDIKIKIR